MYVAAGCHLCTEALEVVERVCAERGEPLAVVRIDGDAVLERAYRQRIPVVEVDGEPAFTYFAHADRLRELLDR